MKKSYIFSGAESVLTDIERYIDRAREEYKAEKEELISYLQGCENEGISPDKYSQEYKESNANEKLVELELWEQAYNYIYENFHKLTKDL